jgi:hypothetical protein
LFKSALSIYTYSRHKIFSYKSDRDLGFEKLTLRYEASQNSYQKTDGVLRTGIPFWTCLPTELGYRQFLAKGRFL